MDIDIIEEEENPMLHRSDVRFELRHEEATPSRLSVRDSLAATLNKDSTEVVVRKLDTKFGMRKTLGTAKVYETPDDALDIEQGHMLERNKISSDGEVITDEAEEDAPAADEDTDAAPDEEADEAEADEDTDEAEADEDTDEAEADDADEEADDAPETDEAETEAEDDGEE